MTEDNSRRPWRKAIQLAGLLASAAMPLQAAQAADGQDEPQEEAQASPMEIVVTAQFREQRLQDTPIAITAVNSAMLEARGQTSLVDVAAQSPNVSLQQQSQVGGPVLIAYIRGIGQADVTPSYDPGVAVYVDDIYLGSLAGSTLKLLDVDRIEVSRGPQGTLSGRNAIGGAVKLYNKKPKGTNTGQVTVSAGEREHIEISASADLSLVKDLLALRVSGVGLSEKGYVDQVDYGCAFPNSGVPALRVQGPGKCKWGTQGGQEYAGGRISLGFTPTPDLDFVLTGDFIKHDDDATTSALRRVDATGNARPLVNPRTGQATPFDNRFVSGDRYTTYASFIDDANSYGPYTAPDSSKLKQWGVSLNVDWQISDHVNLTSITGYRSTDLTIGTDADGSPITLDNSLVFTTNRQFSTELRVSAKTLADRLDLTVGAFYFKRKGSQGGRADGADVPIDFLFDDPNRSNNKSLFAHGIFAVTDRMHITAGIRYTKEHKEYGYFRTKPDGTLDLAPPFLLSTLNGVVGKFNFDRWDYRGVIDYKITDSTLVYAQIATGFKAGGLNPRPFVPQQSAGVGPETLTSYEVGVKSGLFDGLMTFNLAGFYSKYKSIQLAQSQCQENLAAGLPINFPGCPLGNIGNADVKGLEAEVAIHSGGLRVDLSGSYLDFEYKSLRNAVGVSLDMVPPYTQKYRASMGIQYALPLGGGTLTPRFDVNYQSGYFSGSAINYAQEHVPARTLTNARLTYDSADNGWQIALAVENLFDKYYDLSRSYFQRSGILAQFAQPGRPRTALVRVRKNF